MAFHLQTKLKGPDAVGKGSSQFTSIIQQLEARYAGAPGAAEHGYDRDGFVVSDVRDFMLIFRDSHCFLTDTLACTLFGILGRG